MERKSKYKSWSQRISFKVDKSGNKNLKCIKANTKKDISDWNQHAGEMRGRRRRKFFKIVYFHKIEITYIILISAFSEN